MRKSLIWLILVLMALSMPLAGLAEEVEGDIGQRHVLLDLGRVRHPLPQPLGVGQRVVRELGQVAGGQRVAGRLIGRDGPTDRLLSAGRRLVDFGVAHRYSTSSGTS